VAFFPFPRLPRLTVGLHRRPIRLLPPPLVGRSGRSLPGTLGALGGHQHAVTDVETELADQWAQRYVEALEVAPTRPIKHLVSTSDEPVTGDEIRDRLRRARERGC
jgi:hypothetical protein